MNRYFLNKPSEEKGSDSEQESVERLSDLEQVNRRRHDVLDFMLLGMTPQEIADELDEDVRNIEADIEVIVEKGWKGKEEELEEIRKEAVATFRLTRKKAFHAFNLSQGKVEKITDKSGDNKKNGKYSEKKTVTEHKAGDPRFLQVMNDSAEKMAKVTGAQKHREVEINNTIDNRSVNILEPQRRSRLPEHFDEFLRKPDGEMTPDQRREAGLDNIEEEMD